MKLKDFCDLEMAGGFTVLLLAAVLVCAVGVVVGAKVYSAIDCEFRPASERCTLLHERGRNW